MQATGISTAAIVARIWEAVARGDWDVLVADYTEDMVFVMPGQADVLTGRAFAGRFRHRRHPADRRWRRGGLGA